ncbi:MAG: hypothetical protein ABEK04_03805 [Candidatus Nanohalobium sp.]
MNSLSIVLSFLLALLGLAIAAFSVRFLRMIRENQDQAMASFQLHPDQAVSEFRLLYYGLILEFFAFVIYGVGGLIDMTLLLNVGRVISAGFILIAIKIALNWWRRFS